MQSIIKNYNKYYIYIYYIYYFFKRPVAFLTFIIWYKKLEHFFIHVYEIVTDIEKLKLDYIMSNVGILTI